MPEAVIVSTVRSPIGRAVRRLLAEFRPDELVAFILGAEALSFTSLTPCRSRPTAFALARRRLPMSRTSTVTC
jgi:hypothetical protein